MPYIPGFFLAGLIGSLALLLGPKLGVSSTLLALLCGMALSPFYTKMNFKSGIDWSSGFILRVGIAALGFCFVFADVLALGWNILLMIVFAISATLVIGVLCAQALGLRKEFGALTSGAISICGASAAMAITSVLPEHKNKERDLSLAVIGITAISTLEMITYPFAGPLLGLQGADLGMFLGGTIHDVAQTAGAGYSVSEDVGKMAVLTKMIRVSFLLPVVIALMLVFKERGATQKPSVPVPLFLCAFFIFMVLNSLLPVPEGFGRAMGVVSKTALVIAIAAIGLKTNIKDILAVGLKPMILMFIQAVCMAVIVLSCITYL